jgi:spermidine synthase
MSRLRPATELPEVTVSTDGDIRYLHLGSIWIQGSMRVGQPFDIHLEYVQRMLAWLLFVPELNAKSVAALHTMQLGLGAASLTKFCHKRLKAKSTAIELNPQVHAVCRQWFKLPPNDARLQVLIADAAQAVQAPQFMGQVDALMIDLYDHEAAAPVLDTEAFYRHCRALLADDGALSINLFGHQSSYERTLAKLRRVFPGAGRLWAFRPTKEGNTIVCAFSRAQTPDRTTLNDRAEKIESLWKLPARKWVRNLVPVEPQ